VPSGSSGLAETGGDDLIVTLGTFTGQIGTPFDRASLAGPGIVTITR